jgi:hypothetical protein
MEIVREMARVKRSANHGPHSSLIWSKPPRSPLTEVCGAGVQVEETIPGGSKQEESRDLRE